MKAKLFAVLSVLTLLVDRGSSAVVVNVRNFTSATNGITLLTATGAPVTGSDTFFAAVSFEAGTNFNGTIAQILERMTVVSSISAAGSPAAGLVNTPVTYNGGTTVAPTAVVGSAMYIIFGNGNTILNSTQVVILNPNATFIAGDFAGNAALTANVETVAKVVHGLVDTTAPVTQSGNASFTFSASVQPIPEPSALFLGGLGLLVTIRRRR